MSFGFAMLAVCVVVTTCLPEMSKPTLFSLQLSAASAALMIHQIIPQMFRRIGRAFAGRNGASCAKDMFLQRTERVRRRNGSSCAKTLFALDEPRVRRRNGSSCAKTLFRVGRAWRSQGEMGLRRKSPLAGGTVCGAKCDQSSDPQRSQRSEREAAGVRDARRMSRR